MAASRPASSRTSVLTLFAATVLAGGCTGSSNDAPPPPPPAPEIAAFLASESRLVPGAATVLQWSTSNAQRVSLDPGLPQAEGAVVQVSPTQTTTYTLTATGPGGTVSRALTVEVEAPMAPPTQTVAFTETLAGGGILLYWSAVPTASSYIIERESNIEPVRRVLATVAGNQYFFADGTSTANNLYTYHVRGSNSLGVAPEANASALSAPPPPEGPPGPVIGALDGTVVAPGGVLRFTASEPVTWLLPGGPGTGVVGADGTYVAPATTGVALLLARGRAASAVAISIR